MGIELYNDLLAHRKNLKYIIIGGYSHIDKNLLQNNGVKVERILCPKEWTCEEITCQCSTNYQELWQYSAYLPHDWWISDEYDELNDCVPAVLGSLFEKFTGTTPFLVVPDKDGLVGVFLTCDEDGEPCSYVKEVPIVVPVPIKPDEPDVSNKPDELDIYDFPF